MALFDRETKIALGLAAASAPPKINFTKIFATRTENFERGGDRYPSHQTFVTWVEILSAFSMFDSRAIALSLRFWLFSPRRVKVNGRVTCAAWLELFGQAHFRKI